MRGALHGEGEGGLGVMERREGEERRIININHVALSWCGAFIREEHHTYLSPYYPSSKSEPSLIKSPSPVAETYKNNFLGTWTKLGAIRKPIIGAVSGYAVSLLCWLICIMLFAMRCVVRVARLAI